MNFDRGQKALDNAAGRLDLCRVCASTQILVRSRDLQKKFVPASIAVHEDPRQTIAIVRGAGYAGKKAHRRMVARAPHDFRCGPRKTSERIREVIDGYAEFRTQPMATLDDFRARGRVVHVLKLWV